MSDIDVTERANRIWAGLQSRRSAFDGEHSFLGCDVPQGQLQHAIAAFAPLVPGERVLAFLDETLRKNGKGGIVLTDRAIHTRQFGEGVHHQSLDSVRSVDVRAGFANLELVVNGRDLVSCTIAQNRPALDAVREALVAGLELGVAQEAPAAPLPAPPVSPRTAPAGWNPDPTGRHAYRHWDGALWTEHVSDQGKTGVDPLSATAEEHTPDAMAAVAEGQSVATAVHAGPVTPSPMGPPVTVVRNAGGAWNFPQMCVVCSSPDIAAFVKYHGETGINRTVMVDLAFPICSSCKEIAVQGGLQPDGSWAGLSRAPKELRARVKQIRQAVRIKPTSATSWTLKVRFTFSNPQFAAEFAELNP